MITAGMAKGRQAGALMDTDWRRPRDGLDRVRDRLELDKMAGRRGMVLCQLQLQ